MKKNLLLLKTSCFLAVLILCSTVVNSQIRTAQATGNWNAPATWNGGIIPSAGDTVVITNFTVTVNVAAQCKRLVLGTGNVLTRVVISGTNSLNVADDVEIGAPLDASSDHQITVGQGTFSCTNLIMSDILAGNDDIDFTLSSGTATISGAIIMNGAADENFIGITGAGKLNIGGSISQTNGSLTMANTSTVNYNGAAQTVRPQTYTNLELSGTGDKSITGVAVTRVLTMGDAATATTTSPMVIGIDVVLNNTSTLTLGNNFTIDEDLTVAAGATLILGGFDFSVVNLTTINGTLTNNSTAGSKTLDHVVINDGGSFVSTADEDFTFTGNFQINGTGSIVSGAGTWAFSGQGTLSGTASITSAVFSADRTNTGNFSFMNFAVTGGITIDFTNNGVVSVTGSFTGDGDFIQGSSGSLNFSGSTITHSGGFDTDASGNIVNYNGAAQAVRAATYSNLLLSGSDVKTFAAATTVNSLLSIQSTATLAGVAPAYGNTAAILEYKGSVGQTTSNIEFPGTGATPTNIRIDNANGVVLNANKSINGVLTLSNGYLTTSSTSLLTINAAGNATTANGAFVNGPLAKIKTNTALFTFPVGNLSGGLRTIGVTPVSSSNTTYTAEFLSANPRSVPNGTNLGTLAQISGCEYWDLTRTGTANARVTLSWPAAVNSCGSGSYVGNIATLVVAHHNGTAWTDLGQSANSGSPSAGGTITSNSIVTSFSPFALGTTNASQNPLPVMFADVKAYQKNSGIQVDWSNLTERDIVNYVVEHSTDGVSFSVLNQLQPRSNVNDKESYSYFHATPAAGTNFYRIRVNEIGGKIIYSKLLRVDIGSSLQAFNLYPNPVKGNQLTIGLNSKQGVYTLKVVNTAGQQVYAQRLAHQGGSMTQTIELPSSVKPGVYSMLISGDQFHQSKMFIVQ